MHTPNHGDLAISWEKRSWLFALLAFAILSFQAHAQQQTSQEQSTKRAPEELEESLELQLDRLLGPAAELPTVSSLLESMEPLPSLAELETILRQESKTQINPSSDQLPSLGSQHSPETVALLLQELESAELNSEQGLHLLADLTDALSRSRQTKQAERVARVVLHRALELKAGPGDQEAWWRALAYRFWADYLFGLDTTSADEAFRRVLPALARFRGSSDKRVLSLVRLVCMGLLHSGRTPEATGLSDLALELSADLTPEGRSLHAEALRTRVGLHFSVGEFNQAEELLWEAITILRGLEEEPENLAAATAELATLRFGQGDTEEGVYLFRQALEQTESLLAPDHPHLADGSYQLALMLKGQAKKQTNPAARRVLANEARSFLMRAQRIYEAHEMHKGVMLVRANLAEVSDLDPQSSESLADELEDTLEAFKDFKNLEHLQKSDIELDLALRLLHEGKWSQALHYGQRVHRYLHSKGLGRTDSGIAAQSTVARAEYGLGNLDSALTAFEQTIQNLDWMLVNSAQARRRATLANKLNNISLVADYVMCCEQAGRLDQVATIAERTCSRTILDLAQRSERDLTAELRQQDPEGAKTIDEFGQKIQSVRNSIAKLQTTPNAEHKKLEALYRQLHELDDRRQSTLHTLWPTASPAETATIRAQLRPNEALLYLLGGREAAVAVLCPPASQSLDRSQVWQLAKDMMASASLARSIKALRTRYGMAPNQRPKLESTQQANLPALQEILGSISDSYESVVVVSTGFFEGLPLQLVDPELRLEVSYCASGSLLAQLRSRGQVKPLAAKSGQQRSNQALLLGDPLFAKASLERFPTRSGGYLDAMKDLQALPGTREEVLGIADLFANSHLESKTLLGNQATLPELEEVLTEGGGPTWLHLATHGLLGTREYPEHAGLALVMPEEPSAEDSGFLTLDHMLRGWRQRLSACDLVVLSSCDGQVGTEVGDTNMALTWGFFYAGAPSVVASHWKVDDRATAYFMLRFYENLLGQFDQERSWAGRSLPAGQAMAKGVALHEAQIWLAQATLQDLRAYRLRLSSSSPRGAAADTETHAAPDRAQAQSLRPYSDPYYWAPFTLLGNPE